MKVDLDQEETEVLTELLKMRLGQIRLEIHHTDVGTFKERLKHEEHTLQGLTGKLQAQISGSPTSSS